MPPLRHHRGAFQAVPTGHSITRRIRALCSGLLLLGSVSISISHFGLSLGFLDATWVYTHI